MKPQPGFWCGTNKSMKIFCETLAVAFGMFSAVPLPQPEWNKRNMRYALCAFPAVGAVSGAALLGFAALANALHTGVMFRAAGLCLLPVLITGGIHLDGFADTCDALASCADPAKKQQILADPHCGAFAVIRLCSWFLASFALWAQLVPTPRALLCLGIGQVVSRALSGYAVARFPLAKDTGLAHTFASAADKMRTGRFLAALAALGMAGQILCGGVLGASAALAALGCLWHYKKTAQKQFGGISGDLAGWFLVRCELWQLAACVACQLIAGVMP